MLTHRWTYLLLGILLPIFLVPVRAWLGSYGWMTLFMVVGAPVMLLPLGLSLMFFLQPSARLSSHLHKQDARYLLFMYLCYFGMGLFLVDGGDTPEGSGSVFSLHLHKQLESAWWLAYLLGMTGTFLLFRNCVSAVIGMKTRPQVPEEVES